MKCEIWVSEKEHGLRTLKDGLEESYEGRVPDRTFLIGEDTNYSIEEAYIEDDGSIQMSIYGSNGLQFGIAIPFDEWVFQAMRFESFSVLEKVLKNKREEALDIKSKLEAVQKQFEKDLDKEFEKQKKRK